MSILKGICESDHYMPAYLNFIEDSLLYIYKFMQNNPN